MNLGQRIYELRQDKELTLNELARRCNLSASYLSYIEKSKKTPTRDALEKIAKGLNVDLEYLTGDKTPLHDFSWYLSLPSYLQTFLQEPKSIPYVQVAAAAYYGNMPYRDFMKFILPSEFSLIKGEGDHSYGSTFEYMFTLYLKTLAENLEENDNND